MGKLLNSPFIRAPIFSFVVKMGKGALDARRSADAQSGLTAAQSHQVHVVTQYGSSGGSFAYQGNSFRDAGASETPTVTLGCALFCVEK